MEKSIFARKLSLKELLQKKSFFLFGPRGTGKSSLIREELKDAYVFDLLSSTTFSNLSRQPELIEQLPGKDQLIVIDEIQKLPRLLDEVHRLIESKNRKFLLTGSSARKLRRGGSNLLAGRAWRADLFPLTYQEIPDFDLDRALLHGTLPAVYLSEYPQEELRAYVGTYLKEEIQAEAVVRRLEAFVSFLDNVAGKVNGEINYTAIASESGVPARTVQHFFELLEDTLIGFRLAPFNKTQRRKSISRSKFYLFDLGVTNTLLNRKSIAKATDEYGRCFEQFIILEIRAYLSYHRKTEKLTYWRSQSGFEVDAVIGDQLAVEIKSKDLVNNRDLKGVKALAEEQIIKKIVVVSNDSESRIVDGFEVIPWRLFLNRLWKGDFL